ncbi:hypothetical protein [Okeania sp. SIO1I7]|uniref:hypothetical protein n=1 Tax=Okeania sp. SIO1I7 TaxID=2607772 RepID=UPI0013FB1784|nr:hypothetical protein [Okeania sp. SIO1I7]NET24924.1 hypothetical protein [Okeania sp. SIO1I7]
MRKILAWFLTISIVVFSFGVQPASAAGVALGPNGLVYGFNAPTNAQEVEDYISGLNLDLSQDRQLVVVSGTHGTATGAPDKSVGCAEIDFLKEDYKLFHVNNTSYVQVVNYHNIKEWNDFLNKHSNDYIVLAWCNSAYWKGAPFHLSK